MEGTNGNSQEKGNKSERVGVNGGPIGYKNPPADTKFKPGWAGGPGRPSWRKRLRKLLEEKPEIVGERALKSGHTIADEYDLVGLEQALGGDFDFYRYLGDRIYGKVPDKHEAKVSVTQQPIPDRDIRVITTKRKLVDENPDDL